jgi:hypothetical protein
MASSADVLQRCTSMSRPQNSSYPISRPSGNTDGKRGVLPTPTKTPTTLPVKGHAGGSPSEKLGATVLHDAQITRPNANLSVRVLIMTMGTSQRLRFIAQNQKIVPGLQTLRAVDGKNASLVLSQLLVQGLQFKRLCSGYETMGNVANFLSRFLAFKAQLRDRVPFQATIEDDLHLDSGFLPFVAGVAYAARWPSDGRDGSKTYVRLGHYGEGYVTSLDSARALVERMQEAGIAGCPDQQMNAPRYHRLPIADVSKHTPWHHLVAPNQGDLHRTQHFSPSQLEALASITSRTSSTGLELAARTKLALEKLRSAPRQILRQSSSSTSQFRTP